MKRNAFGACKRHPMLHAVRRGRVQDKFVMLGRFLGKTLVPEISQCRSKSFWISGASTPTDAKPFPHRILAVPLEGCLIRKLGGVSFGVLLNTNNSIISIQGHMLLRLFSMGYLSYSARNPKHFRNRVVWSTLLSYKT